MKSLEQSKHSHHDAIINSSYALPERRDTLLEKFPIVESLSLLMFPHPELCYKSGNNPVAHFFLVPPKSSFSLLRIWKSTGASAAQSPFHCATAVMGRNGRGGTLISNLPWVHPGGSPAPTSFTDCWTCKLKCVPTRCDKVLGLRRLQLCLRAWKSAGSWPQVLWPGSHQLDGACLQG